MDYYRFTISIPKHPWRWLRFRLSTILLLITTAALISGWRTDHLEQIAKLRQLSAEIARIENPGPR